MVAGLPRAAGETGLLDGLGFLAPLAARVAQPAGERADANGDTGVVEEGQQRRLRNVSAVTEGQREGLDMRAEGAVVASRQRRGECLTGTGHEPDFAHEADDLRLQHQILHECLGSAVADGVSRQVGWIDRAGVLAGDRQVRVFTRLAARGAGLALGFGGVVG